MFHYIENSTEVSDIWILRYLKTKIYNGFSLWTLIDCAGTGACYQLPKIQLYF